MLRATDDTNVWVSGIQWPHGGGIPAQGRTKLGGVALPGQRGVLDDATPQEMERVIWIKQPMTAGGNCI